MARSLRDRVLGISGSLGLTTLMAKTSWRNERLLILCYHGISKEDEHEWDGELYVSPDHLRNRLEIIRRKDFNVLPLGEALDRLSSGHLPPRSVVLTFDDGASDFATEAYPILKEFGYPATVYLTTHYVRHQSPVFNTMLSYLLWKGRGEVLDLPAWAENRRVQIPTDQRMRGELWNTIYASLPSDWRSADKDEFLARLAGELGVDWEYLTDRRVLFLMDRDELNSLDRDLIDVQIHTHRHRTPPEKSEYLGEVERNRSEIAAILGEGERHHFCYPSGMFNAEQISWLREEGILSATTCEPGLVSSRSDRLMLPRFVDTMHATEPIFVGWLSGMIPFLRNRGG